MYIMVITSNDKIPINCSIFIYINYDTVWSFKLFQYSQGHPLHSHTDTHTQHKNTHTKSFYIIYGL